MAIHDDPSIGKGQQRSNKSSTSPDHGLFSFIFWLRMTLASTLLCLISGFGAGTYITLRENELTIFTEEFQSIATQISIQISSSMGQKINTAYVVRSMYRTAIAAGVMSAPNMTLPGFEEIMNGVLPFAQLRSIQFAPLVRTDQAASWEQYARHHVADLDGPSSLSVKRSSDDWVVADGIFQFTPDGRNKVKSPTSFGNSAYPHWLFPLWQVAPIANNAGVVMLEVHNQNNDIGLIDKVCRLTENDPSTVHSAITEPFQLFQDGPTKLRPSTVMYTPAASTTGVIFGMQSFVLTWDEMFNNILSSYHKRVYVVPTTKTSTFTFALDGPVVSVLGASALHEKGFAKFGIPVNGDPTLEANGYSFTVYPSAEMYNRYNTQNPANTCSLVVGLSVFIALVILFYSWILQKQQTALVYAASRDAALESKKQFVRYLVTSRL